MADLPHVRCSTNLAVTFSNYYKIFEALEIYKEHVNSRPKNTPIENEILLTVMMGNGLKLSYDVIKKYVDKMDQQDDQQDLDEFIRVS